MAVGGMFSRPCCIQFAIHFTLAKLATFAQCIRGIRILCIYVHPLSLISHFVIIITLSDKLGWGTVSGPGLPMTERCHSWYPWKQAKICTQSFFGLWSRTILFNATVALFTWAESTVNTLSSALQKVMVNLTLANAFCLKLCLHMIKYLKVHKAIQN